jgi:hypothetical protein
MSPNNLVSASIIVDSSSATAATDALERSAGKAEQAIKAVVVQVARLTAETKFYAQQAAAAAVATPAGQSVVGVLRNQQAMEALQKTVTDTSRAFTILQSLQSNMSVSGIMNMSAAAIDLFGDITKVKGAFATLDQQIADNAATIRGYYAQIKGGGASTALMDQIAAAQAEQARLMGAASRGRVAVTGDYTGEIARLTTQAGAIQQGKGTGIPGLDIATMQQLQQLAKQLQTEFDEIAGKSTPTINENLEASANALRQMREQLKGANVLQLPANFMAQYTQAAEQFGASLSTVMSATMAQTIKTPEGARAAISELKSQISALRAQPLISPEDVVLAGNLEGIVGQIQSRLSQGITLDEELTQARIEADRLNKLVASMPRGQLSRETLGQQAAANEQVAQLSALRVGPAGTQVQIPMAEQIRAAKDELSSLQSEMRKTPRDLITPEQVSRARELKGHIATMNSSMKEALSSSGAGIQGIIFNINNIVSIVTHLQQTFLQTYYMIWMAVNKAMSYMREGLEHMKVEEVFREMSAAAQESSLTTIAAMDVVTNGVIDEMNLMKQVNRTYMADSADMAKSLPQLLQVSQEVAKATGRDTQEAFETMVNAIMRGRARALWGLNIYVDQRKANEDYAASLGKTVSNLSMVERRQALLNAVLAQTAPLMKGNTSEATEQELKMKSLGAAWSTFMVGVSKGVTRGPIPDIVGALGQALRGANISAASTASYTEAIDKVKYLGLDLKGVQQTQENLTASVQVMPLQYQLSLNALQELKAFQEEQIRLRRGGLEVEAQAYDKTVEQLTVEAGLADAVDQSNRLYAMRIKDLEKLKATTSNYNKDIVAGFENQRAYILNLRKVEADRGYTQEEVNNNFEVRMAALTDEINKYWAALVRLKPTLMDIGVASKSALTVEAVKKILDEASQLRQAFEEAKEGISGTAAIAGAVGKSMGEIAGQAELAAKGVGAMPDIRPILMTNLNAWKAYYKSLSDSGLLAKEDYEDVTHYMGLAEADRLKTIAEIRGRLNAPTSIPIPAGDAESEERRKGILQLSELLTGKYKGSVTEAYAAWSQLTEAQKKDLPEIAGLVQLASLGVKAFAEGIDEAVKKSTGFDAMRGRLFDIASTLTAMTSQMQNMVMAPQLKMPETLLGDTSNIREWISAFGELDFGEKQAEMDGYVASVRKSVDAFDAQQEAVLATARGYFDASGALNYLRNLLGMTDAPLSQLASAFGATFKEGRRSILDVIPASVIFKQAIDEMRAKVARPMLIQVKLQGLEAAVGDVNSMAASLYGVLSLDKINEFRSQAIDAWGAFYTQTEDMSAQDIDFLEKINTQALQKKVSDIISANSAIEGANKDHLNKLAQQAQESKSKIEAVFSEAVQVTAQDVAETNAGQYKDKSMENARRLAAIAQGGREFLLKQNGSHEDWIGILGIPPELLAPNSEAEQQLKAWAARLQKQVQNLEKPDMINWEAFVEEYRAKLEAEGTREGTIAKAQVMLANAGLLSGKTEEEKKKETMKALGMTDAEIKLATSFEVDKDASSQIQKKVLGDAKTLGIPISFIFSKEGMDAFNAEIGKPSGTFSTATAAAVKADAQAAANAGATAAVGLPKIEAEDIGLPKPASYYVARTPAKGKEPGFDKYLATYGVPAEEVYGDEPGRGYAYYEAYKAKVQPKKTSQLSVADQAADKAQSRKAEYWWPDAFKPIDNTEPTSSGLNVAQTRAIKEQEDAVKKLVEQYNKLPQSKLAGTMTPAQTVLQQKIATASDAIRLQTEGPSTAELGAVGLKPTLTTPGMAQQQFDANAIATAAAAVVKVMPAFQGPGTAEQTTQATMHTTGLERLAKEQAAKEEAAQPKFSPSAGPSPALPKTDEETTAEAKANLAGPAQVTADAFLAGVEEIAKTQPFSQRISSAWATNVSTNIDKFQGVGKMMGEAVATAIVDAAVSGVTRARDEIITAIWPGIEKRLGPWHAAQHNGALQ